MEIVFSCNNSIISKLVRYFTQSSVSHVSLRLDDNWMIDSTPENGIQPGWWNNFVKKTTVKNRFEIIGIDKDILKESFESILNEMIGQGYDFLSVVGYVISKILGVFYLKFDNILGSSKLYTCSEFVLKVSKEIQQKTGKTLYFGEFETVVPQDLLEQSFENEFLLEIV